ncbi:MAG: hypothetical protein ETSY2_11635 [Candidatus Entotheonella gemina]|uniref:Uncharacterized protein n=1 Tax=Candidatus Entotheonella gemina TaxID=1429439 RepID=W4MAI2_9BACT|nr:MAG: hypothetical protein ETSY2_11635 [Candidatus Entotheonella gemina]
MSLIDWLIVGAYVVTALVIGLYFTKRAAPSTAHFFVAGRSLPWFVAGTSIVATTFSADTPLVVAGLSRQSGIYENWFWWSAAIGQLATVFFFARLWRRTGIMTDIEFLVLRYEPSAARSALRIFKVVFDGILVNCIIMASVTFAMAKVINVLLDLSPTPLFHLPLVGGVTSTALVLILLAGTACPVCIAFRPLRRRIHRFGPIRARDDRLHRTCRHDVHRCRRRCGYCGQTRCRA